MIKELISCPAEMGILASRIYKYENIFYNLEEGSYLPSNRNSPKSEGIENAPLAILISTEQF